jgi:DNA-binding CsgD family transcriptional regulator
MLERAMADLSRLSHAEREVLNLLAEGHTAKSIASRLGLTPGSVNDRLRSARRKTGVSSSRELARLLHADERWDPKNGTEKIGLAGAPPIRQLEETPAGKTKRRPIFLGVFVVATLASGAGALLAMALVSSNADNSSRPHIVSTFPANNARIKPGKLALTVTFDQAMSPGSYSFVQHDAATFPSCQKIPSQSADGRKFILQCVTEPQRDYLVGFNSPTHHNFTSAVSRAPSEPLIIRFSTR